MALAPTSRARLQASLACLGGGVLAWRTHSPFAFAFAALLVVGALLAWVAPARYAPVQRVLDRIVHGFLALLTWLLLGLVYFGLFTPLRLLRALRPGNFLEPTPAPTAHVESYLHPLPPADPARFGRQF